ncbi:alpha/beta hydrolase [Actinomadura sp. GC306]|uniref:alpha/beta hydrolase fold domain-containing protein n=1 Tax=Actinomadura sp. GC306 TaxID=2530367 RepID=UPI00104E8930|nr:alpha/beta hydrolase fold domain-containing protein [Actinomadura sp. GC306]TDC71830.1 alpha/beta hydrolase [Actinomadura sp. GC306]
MAGETWTEESPVGPLVQPTVSTGTVVLYLHGDRYPHCGPDSVLDLAGRLARRAGARVVCARYRPVFPDALNDVHSAYEYCRKLGPVAVVGERLGAGLAVALLVRLRDSAAEMPWCAALHSALLDMTLQAQSLQLNASAEPSFDLTELRRYVARYTAGTAPTEPLVSPLFANLHGLPPIQLRVAGTDPLLDDSLAFTARAARSGVAVELGVHPDADGLRRDALEATANFVRTPRTRRPCSPLRRT